MLRPYFPFFLSLADIPGFPASLSFVPVCVYFLPLTLPVNFLLSFLFYPSLCLPCLSCLLAAFLVWLSFFHACLLNSALLSVCFLSLPVVRSVLLVFRVIRPVVRSFVSVFIFFRPVVLSILSVFLAYKHFVLSVSLVYRLVVRSFLLSLLSTDLSSSLSCQSFLSKALPSGPSYLYFLSTGCRPVLPVCLSWPQACLSFLSTGFVPVLSVFLSCLHACRPVFLVFSPAVRFFLVNSRPFLPVCISGLQLTCLHCFFASRVSVPVVLFVPAAFHISW